MAKPSPARALVAYLRGVPAIATIVDTRVFLEELPQAESKEMPRPAIVVASAGGGLMGHGQLYGDRRFDLLCYAESAARSRDLYEEVRAAMKALLRETVADTSTTAVLLHWARISTDGTTSRDPKTDWPVTGSSWQVLASDVHIPA